MRNQNAQPEVPWEELVSGERDDIASGHRYLCDPVARAKHEAFIFGKPLTEVEGEGEPEQPKILHPKADSSEVEEGREEELSIQAKCDGQKQEEEAVNLKADTPPVEDPKEEIHLKAETPQVKDSEEINLSQVGIQTQLKIGQPGDKYEQEADAKAAEVMKMEDPAASPEIEEESSDNAIQKQPLAETITPLVQRQEAVQRKGNQEKGNGAKIEEKLGQGGGQSLGQETRSFMESRFGADFSGVRVHTDSAAVQMNKDLGAQAFTHGQDIYYGKGKSPGKNELTAHELTHTIQQTGGNLQAKTLNQQENKKDNKIQAKNLTNLKSSAAPKALTSLEKVSQEQSQFETRTSAPERDEDLYAIVDGGVISIPLGIGVILVVVGAAGIVINWRDISGTVTQLGQIAIDWANDTTIDVTIRIINLVSQAGVATLNELEGFRGVIEAVIEPLLSRSRGRSREGPTKAECTTAKKILTEYERLAQDHSGRIPRSRLEELNRLRDSGSIRRSDLPGSLQRVFPGIFGNKTLDEIREMCRRS